MSKWIAQYRYGDDQKWQTLGGPKPVAQRAKSFCQELLQAEPNNAHQLQFRTISVNRDGRS